MRNLLQWFCFKVNQGDQLQGQGEQFHGHHSPQAGSCIARSRLRSHDTPELRNASLGAQRTGRLTDNHAPSVCSLKPHGPSWTVATWTVEGADSNLAPEMCQSASVCQICLAEAGQSRAAEQEAPRVCTHLEVTCRNFCPSVRSWHGGLPRRPALALSVFCTADTQGPWGPWRVWPLSSHSAVLCCAESGRTVALS